MLYLQLELLPQRRVEKPGEIKGLSGKVIGKDDDIRRKKVLRKEEERRIKSVEVISCLDFIFNILM